MIINDKPRHYTGLSTDTKPNLGYSGNGYVFFESDSGLEYVYNGKIGAWIPMSETTDTPCTGILKIEKTSSEGLIDNYTIYYTNGAQTTYQVTNGEHGTRIAISDHNTWVLDGVDTGVSAVGEKGEQGIPGKQGPQGEKGDTGNVISVIRRDDAIIAVNPDTGEETVLLTLEEVKGEKGDKGDQGEQGIQGEKGDQGEQGEKGDTGNGIETIEKTSSSPDGLTDTYTITFTNGETTTFTVKNGNGIIGFTKTSEGLADTYTLQFADGSTQEFTVTNGESAYQIDKRLHSEDPTFPASETDWEDWIVPNINPDTLTWQIKGRDTGIYAKGSDEKYQMVYSDATPQIDLEHNKAFICKGNISGLEIRFPNYPHGAFPGNITPGWISEVTFKSTVVTPHEIKIFTDNLTDDIKLIYYHLGKVRQDLDFKTGSTVNLVFQYDGLNIYCYYTEIADDITD